MRRIPLVLVAMLVVVTGCRERDEGIDSGAADTAGSLTVWPPLGEEALLNGQYQVLSPEGEQATVTLVQGIAEKPTGTEIATYELFEQTASGDLNGDGSADAAVVILSNFGGSGVFAHLHALVNATGKAQDTDRFELGDRIQVDSLAIDSGMIIIHLTTHGPGDPACCPSLHTMRRFALREGKLEELGGARSPISDSDSAAAV